MIQDINFNIMSYNNRQSMSRSSMNSDISSRSGVADIQKSGSDYALYCINIRGRNKE